MDAFSRYTWLYPMHKKSDAFNIFLKFQLYVERFFNAKIKSVQSDWGGEYRSISKNFQNCGIVHRVSCPHTHQQNGSIERKHRHVVESGLALLSHVHAPLRYWDQGWPWARAKWATVLGLTSKLGLIPKNFKALIERL